MAPLYSPNEKWHPSFPSQIKSKCRRAYFLPHCISTERRTINITYGSFGHVGRILNSDSDNKHDPSKLFQEVCLPLFSVMSAMGRKKIDYFSLDVEGWEEHILKTIPFESLDIKVRARSGVGNANTLYKLT